MTKKIYADLHNHTTDSDGDFTADELIKKAKSLGIHAVGVTNHDTVKGLKSAVNAGKKYDLKVIPGVEISIRFKEKQFTGTLHLLSYFTPDRLDDDDFMNAMQNVLSQGRGEGLVKARVKEINRVFGPVGQQPLLDRDIRVEDISTLSSNASRRHFALALNQRFGITDPDKVSQIIGNDSPAYLPSGIDFHAASGLVNTHGLMSVLAHPAAGSFPGKGHYKEVLPPVETVEGFLPQFLNAGLNGIEAFYPGHTKEHEALMVAWAEKNGLLVTGGSDTHDAVNRPPGVSGLDKKRYDIFIKELTKGVEPK